MTSTACSSPDGLILGLNGAEERLQLVLGHARPEGGGALLAAQEWTVPGESVRFLAPSLQAMLRALRLEPGDVTRIACVRGPGSFTGLRLSLAMAEALAAVHGQPRAGIEHPRLLARRAAPLLSGPLAVLTHSRRRQVYVQVFGPDAAPATPLRACTLDEAAALLRETVAAADAPPALLGSGLRRNAEFFAPLIAELGLRDLGPRWDAPSPQNLLDAACDPELRYADAPVEPLYMRPSDAEENLDAIARQRGLDPATAREMLRRSRES